MNITKHYKEQIKKYNHLHQQATEYVLLEDIQDGLYNNSQDIATIMTFDGEFHRLYPSKIDSIKLRENETQGFGLMGVEIEHGKVEFDDHTKDRVDDYFTLCIELLETSIKERHKAYHGDIDEIEYELMLATALGV